VHRRSAELSHRPGGLGQSSKWGNMSAVAGMTPKLYRENMIILMVLQAIDGVLSSAVKGLSVEFGEAGDVSAYFLLWEESASDRLEIEENLATEVSVLTNGLPEVGEAVVRPVIELVSEKPPDYRPPGRSVFLFR
jgi:hypothetical protein